MKPSIRASAALACGALVVIPASASADIVKVPTGESAQLTLLSSVRQGLKGKHVSVSRTGSAKAAGTGFALPYTLSRWDFSAHEGDVAYFAKNTGIRFRLAGGRSIALVHPRVVVDGSHGYITGLISNVRVKTFTFTMNGKISDTALLQTISGLRLKLTKASADFLNAGLRHKVLRPYTQFATLTLRLRKPAAAATSPGGASGTTTTVTPLTQAPGQGGTPGATLSLPRNLLAALPVGSQLTALAPATAVDTDGDSQPDSGVYGLGLTSSTLDAAARTGAIKLNGGLAVRAGGQDVAVLDDPEIVLGTTGATSGLFATVNGARLKVGDIDPSTLDLNVANGTATIKGLDVRASLAGAALLDQLLSTTAIVPGGELLTLDLAVPQT